MRKTRTGLWCTGLASLALLAAGCGARSGTDVKVHGMGETADAGSFGYQVTGTDWVTRIGEGAEAKSPVHRFLVVRLSVFNRSSSDLVIPAAVLLDENDRACSEVPGLTMDPKWLGLTRKARPNETTQGNVVFDVPPGHYRLRLTDESGMDKFAFIDIPLRLQTDFESGNAR